MNTPWRRLKPTPITLGALLGLIWALTFGAVRDFVWADLKAGLIDLRGLSRVTRGLILFGFALMALMIGLLLFNDFWRASADLVPLTNSLAGRGTLAPLSLLPATLFLLAMAWSFALAGALHSHWAIRLGVVSLFALVSVTWIGAKISLGSPWGGLVALAGVIVFILVRQRRQPRLGIEFSVLLGLVSLTFLFPQAQGVADWRISGTPLLVSKVNGHVLTLSALILPLLLLVGLSMANFTYMAAGWTVRIVQDRLPHIAVFGLLAIALTLRLHNVLATAIETFIRAPEQEVWAFLGALGMPACIGIAWWGARRLAVRTTEPEPLSSQGVLNAADRAALPLIIGYTLVQLYIFVMLDLVMAFVANVPNLEVSAMAQLAASAYADFLNNQYTPVWRVVFFGLVVVAGITQARRGRQSLAVYLCAFGLTALWIEMADIGRPLSLLTWYGPAYTDFWWVIIFGVVALAWLIRRELTPARAAALLLVVLVSGLLRQTDFINNRFTPFFGFAGVGFVAFGLIWDALTAGSWANVSSPGLPRAGRIFLYLGYVLLTVTLVNWALTTHNLSQTAQLTGDAATFGLDRFGKPMLYAIYLTTLWPASHAKP
ncbi:MAG: hypothetical protein ACUVRU_01840 [Anaerolineae bacterium]